ncbi:MAG: AbrB/MazE/SpoVT family DNA-binding domain-containing protein [Chitinivibrionales bacterium]|nr:AbrB/MazE/SpoVT family DNA-binding domain-containing protein [Chitinivibrionales bacterium]
MDAVKISPKYQVVIPRRVRESMRLRPGQRMQVVEYDNRIELVPIQRVSRLRGFAKGINTRIEREGDRV